MLAWTWSYYPKTKKRFLPVLFQRSELRKGEKIQIVIPPDPHNLPSVQKQRHVMAKATANPTASESRCCASLAYYNKRLHNIKSQVFSHVRKKTYLCLRLIFAFKFVIFLKKDSAKAFLNYNFLTTCIFCSFSYRPCGTPHSPFFIQF